MMNTKTSKKVMMTVKAVSVRWGGRMNDFCYNRIWRKLGWLGRWFTNQPSVRIKID